MGGARITRGMGTDHRWRRAAHAPREPGSGRAAAGARQRPHAGRTEASSTWLCTALDAVAVGPLRVDHGRERASVRDGEPCRGRRRDRIQFDIVSSRFPGTPAQTRHFAGFSHALEEVIDARVWGGIHFRTADTQGVVIDRKVARWQRKHYFRPVCRSKRSVDSTDTA